MATQRVTIGSDPEIIFTDREGKLVNASNHLNKNAKFGLDGHPWIAELRPDHAVFPRDLVENIRRVLAVEAERLKDLVWLAGPWLKDKPMGGHIHFGVPYEDRFVDALDNQLGFLLALSEPTVEAKMRRTVKFQGSVHDDFPYGVLGNVRKKPYGFEYRTPATFLASPGIALATITAAKAIVLEESERGSMAWSQLPSHTRLELTVNKEDFNNANKPVFMGKLDSFWKMLRAMKYFQKGAEGHSLWSSMAYLKSRVFPADGFKMGHDIKVKWGFEGINSKKPSRSKKESVPFLISPKFWGEEFRLIPNKTEQLPTVVVALHSTNLWEMLEKIL